MLKAASSVSSRDHCRFIVYQIKENECLFAIIAHHISCDATSLGILEQELSSSYAAYQHNTEPLLPQPGHEIRRLGFTHALASTRRGSTQLLEQRAKRC